MRHQDLGPQPTPTVDPPPPPPGGADAEPEPPREVLPADLDLDLNPAVDSSRLDQRLQQGESTSTAATRDEEPPSNESPD